MRLITDKEIIKIQKKELHKNEEFNFLCHKKLSCFNNCCKNLNLFIYPYDIIRIKNNLKIKSDIVIKKYLDVIMRKGNSLPDVLIKMSDNKKKTCPFLKKTGCSIYQDRPYSCRIFPVEEGSLYNPFTDNYSTISFFKPPNFCMGKNEKMKWTKKSWTKNQNIEIYNKMTNQWSIVKRLFNKKPILNTNNIRMIFTASYNIDFFREFVFKSNFLKRNIIKPEIIKKIKINETALLEFGFQWIKSLAKTHT